MHCNCMLWQVLASKVAIFAKRDERSSREVPTERAVCLVMELATGGDLDERLAQHGAYPEVKARQLTMRIASAIHFTGHAGPSAI